LCYSKYAGSSSAETTWFVGKFISSKNCIGITSATNDIGIITLPDGRHLAVAAFVSNPAANDNTRDAIIARLAKAAWDRAQSLGR
jgi:beta-lactamase class A